MAIVFETTALVRPLFTAADFAPTKWEGADIKVDFANKLCRFIAEDFKESLFTKALYHRLHQAFGLIAHYNRDGFHGTYFRDVGGKVTFLEELLQWPCFGDPEYTYSDVERAIRQRLRDCDLLTAYRALQAAEIERRERETLRRLSAKYAPENDVQPTAPPVLITYAPGRSARPKAAPSDQASLF
jgi:hypothetical protein